jgi:RNA polymerase sigma-70 factor (ECF subfamily)
VTVFDVEIRGVPAVQDEMTEIERVFKQYGPSVTYFFARRGFSTEDCRDLTQETFVRALGGLSGFRRDAKIETWLLRIAANVWKNHLRSRKAIKRDAPTVSLDAAREQGGEAAEAPGPAARGWGPGRPAGPQERLLEQERARMLRDAVATLPPRMRRCTLLRIDRGLKYREIAAILKVSIDTVKTQLHQARYRLKEQLQEYFDLEEAGE